ncbi:MAG: hypothetical protein HQL50_12270 [Magnetococcales bacterium]|nr:hypothetical protein [Magnetococcales bacterium]
MKTMTRDSIRRIFKVCAVLVLGVGMTVGPWAAGTSWARREARKPVIVCFGDSLTSGYKVGRYRSYPGLLERRLREQKLNYRVVHEGVPGDTTEKAYQRLDWVLGYNPDIVIIILGANDWRHRLGPSTMRYYLELIIQGFLAQGTEVILGGLRMAPKEGPMMTGEPYYHVLLELAQQYPIHFIPNVIDGIFNNEKYTIEDGMHPNETGYRLMFEHIWRNLRPLIQKRKSSKPAAGVKARPAKGFEGGYPPLLR